LLNTQMILLIVFAAVAVAILYAWSPR